MRNYAYFSAVETESIETLRSAFRKKCLELHPDKGGDAVKFAAMKNEYDILIKLAAAGEAGRANQESREARFNFESEKELAEMIEKLMKVSGIIIEVCGSWLWISGNTFVVHEQLKCLGLKFSGQKKCWYWASTIKQGKVRGRYSMDKIRSKFGSMVLESEAAPVHCLAA
jgi:curved DNA-binding protein CbpA